MADGLQITDASNGVYQLTIDAYPVGSLRRVEGGWRPVDKPDYLFVDFTEAAIYVVGSAVSELSWKVERIRDVLLASVSRGELVAPNESKK